VLDAPHLFDRPGSPYLAPHGGEWADNGIRFAALGSSIMKLAVHRGAGRLRGVLTRLSASPRLIWAAAAGGWNGACGTSKPGCGASGTGMNCCAGPCEIGIDRQLSSHRAPHPAPNRLRSSAWQPSR
jgi:hypothetical protein